ncbi:MAG: hypothetical protein QM770_24610 [Tepidisphaeraceae bacterium]
MRDGVGLLNEYWTGQSLDIATDPKLRELMLAATPAYPYHTPGVCGAKRPARVVAADDRLLPGVAVGTPVQVRGCAPAYLPRPEARVLVAQHHRLAPADHGIADVPHTLPLPTLLAGQLGEGRVLVCHAWPTASLFKSLDLNERTMMQAWLDWLTEPRRSRRAGARAELPDAPP